MFSAIRSCHSPIALTLLFLFSISPALNATNNKSKNKEKSSVREEFPFSDTMSKGYETAPLIFPQEKHFANMIQLTNRGDNAEGYWGFKGDKLIFQRTDRSGGVDCDQIFWGYLPKSRAERFKFKQVSTGQGRTTCSYFMAGDTALLFASTHKGMHSCPTPLPHDGQHYYWQLHPEYEIYTSDLNGNIRQQLTRNYFYDAEATMSPQGDKMVYTSTKGGDIDLWVRDLRSGEEIQISTDLGYDGGAFFSPDGKQLIWRASRPTKPEDVQKYKNLLDSNLVEPTDMELFIGNVDGTDVRQLTKLGNANWAPFFHPSGKKILFCSNHNGGGFHFNLYMINTDGSGLEQVSYDDHFDSFPMFSPDGKKLIFASNRNNGGNHNTNLFLVDWVD